MARYAKLSGKILLLLANGLLLGYARGYGAKNELLKECDRIWYSIDRNQLFHLLRILRMGNFVELREDIDGNRRVSISQKGKERAARLMLDELKITKPKRWDKKWRIVIFDVPEERRILRDALRNRLKILGFMEFQKSVFAFPYPCEDEINIIINYYGLRENVRYLESSLSYDADLRKFFKV